MFFIEGSYFYLLLQVPGILTAPFPQLYTGTQRKITRMHSITTYQQVYILIHDTNLKVVFFIEGSYIHFQAKIEGTLGRHLIAISTYNNPY